MRIFVAASCLALLAPLTLAGCGGEEPTAKPKPSASASPTAPPGLDDTAPSRPAKPADTPAGAVEYGRYFALLVQYAIETRDSRVLYAEAFDQAGCTACRGVAGLIADLKRTGYWQRSEPIELGRLRSVPIKDGVRVVGQFVYPEVEDVKVSGEVEETVPATPYRYYVDLRWDAAKSTWVVMDFLYAKND